MKATSTDLWRLQIMMLPIRRKGHCVELDQAYLHGATQHGATLRGARQRDEKYRRILDAMKPGMRYTTQEVSDLVGNKSHQGTLARLKEMKKIGHIEQHFIDGLGGKKYFHWLKPKGTPCR
jgi:hypothetical protein